MQHTLGYGECLGVALQILGENDELVAAQPRHGIAVAHHLLQTGRYGNEQMVA